MQEKRVFNRIKWTTTKCQFYLDSDFNQPMVESIGLRPHKKINTSQYITKLQFSIVRCGQGTVLNLRVKLKYFG